MEKYKNSYQKYGQVNMKQAGELRIREVVPVINREMC